MGQSETTKTRFQTDWTLKDRRILLVDDDPDQAFLIRDVLEEHQARVSHVETGQGCLAKDFNEFDMVLVDFYLPDTTGGELVVEILKKRNLPIILVTVEKSHDVAVGAIRLGASDYVCKAGDYLRILPVVLMKSFERFRVAHENEDLRNRLEEQIRENESQNETLQQMAALDPLTRLKNHRYMQERLETEINLAGRHLLPLSIVMADIDALGQVNLDYDIETGDRVLRKLAEIFREESREIGIAGRFGGGEFMVILPGTDMIDAVMVAQRLRLEIETASLEGGEDPVRVTASFGVAGFNAQEFAGRKELVNLAQRAVGYSKEEGGNRVSWPE